MKWPQHLIDLLSRGMEVTPIEGLTPGQVYLEFLDEVARRAVWRSRGQQDKLGMALRTPYTPIGSITSDCINGLAKRLCLHGPEWSTAVEAIHEFMEENAETICLNFQNERQPYDDYVGIPLFPDKD